MNLSELLTIQSAKMDEKLFLEYEKQHLSESSQTEPGFHQTFTYREFNDSVNRACRYLETLGLEPGDVYNLHLSNSPTFLILWFAGIRLGAVMMPTNVLASTSELSYLLGHSKSRVSFTTSEYQEKLNECQKRVRCLQYIVVCDPDTHDPASGTFEWGMAQFPADEFDSSANPDDLAAIMYTSGTTSKPKGVMVTHQNYIKAGQTVADELEVTTNDRHFVVLPLFHGNAQYYSTMSAIVSGASIVLMDRFSASRFFDQCIKYQCTIASLFAAPIRMLLAQKNNPTHRNNRLRIVIYAQNITQQQTDEWNRRFRAPLSQLWGMTETMGPPLMNPYRRKRKNRSIGKPIGGYEIRLVDPFGSEPETGQPGEITVKGIPGETIMLGYFDNPEATQDTIRDGWLHTGDNAVMDDDGFYYFVDRLKDMIKRSGENIAAGEVESVIVQHPAIFECAVIGVPDDIRDEKIIAVVVMKDSEKVSEQELLQFCRLHLSRFRIPESIIFKSDLPKTSVGKIQKHLIKQEIISGSDPG